MVNHYFVFDGKMSINYGVRITKPSILDAPAPRVTVQQIPGRSGDLVIPDGGYENAAVSYNCFLKAPAPEKLPEYAGKIKAWLLSTPGEYKRLEDSYDPEYFRYAYFNGALAIERQAKRFGVFDVVFACKPFRYRKDGQKAEEIEKGSAIYNPEEYPADPYIKITGNGNIRITIGSDSWDFSDVDEYIEIDCESKNAYKEYQPQNTKMSGEGFPKLEPGKNNITWTGNVQKVEIIPRWCAL